MSQFKFLVIFFASLTLFPACMTYPGNGEEIDPFNNITLKGFVDKPDRKIYIYLKNSQRVVGVMEASTGTNPITDHGNPPTTLYPWQVEGNFNNFVVWDGPQGSQEPRMNTLRVIPSLVPPNADNTGPSENAEGKTLLIFKPGQEHAIIKYVTVDHPTDWTMQQINDQFSDPGKGAATIQAVCGVENKVCCNGNPQCNLENLRCGDKGRCVY